jgi:hypothetical protein
MGGYIEKIMNELDRWDKTCWIQAEMILIDNKSAKNEV